MKQTQVQIDAVTSLSPLIDQENGSTENLNLYIKMTFLHMDSEGFLND